jgi:hypothetical protein
VVIDQKEAMYTSFLADGTVLEGIFAGLNVDDWG